MSPSVDTSANIPLLKLNFREIVKFTKLIYARTELTTFLKINRNAEAKI
jgi:hypothetical protein